MSNAPAEPIVDARPWRVVVSAVTADGYITRSCGHSYQIAAMPERWPASGDVVDCMTCQTAAMTAEPTVGELLRQVDALPPAISQLALDNLAETLHAVCDEAKALLGVTLSSASIGLHRVPAAVYHSFPQPSEYSTDPPRRAAWKYIATHEGARIVAYCFHAGDCPDLPKGDES